MGDVIKIIIFQNDTTNWLREMNDELNKYYHEGWYVEHMYYAVDNGFGGSIKIFARLHRN